MAEKDAATTPRARLFIEADVDLENLALFIKEWDAQCIVGYAGPITRCEIVLGTEVIPLDKW